MSEEGIRVSWYGRCCFLVEDAGRKVLFDPYDAFCNVEMGRVNADILVSSSTWHDHGHIGASPSAYVFTYPGKYEHNGIVITGIEALEERGSPTVIFNIQLGEFSITNFADFGPSQEAVFERKLDVEMREVLMSTNIAFVRPMIKGEVVREKNEHVENYTKYCSPLIIFPEHYFPQSFIAEQVPVAEKSRFEKPSLVVDEMLESLGLPKKEVQSYFVDIKKRDLTKKEAWKFMRLHPQVVYR